VAEFFAAVVVLRRVARDFYEQRRIGDGILVAGRNSALTADDRHVRKGRQIGLFYPYFEVRGRYATSPRFHEDELDLPARPRRTGTARRSATDDIAVVAATIERKAPKSAPVHRLPRNPTAVMAQLWLTRVRAIVFWTGVSNV
jgi:hypothetical protein